MADALTGLPPVVVMGVSGSGKTTVGQLLADLLGVRFAEGDDLHPAANVAKMRAGLPLDDADREPWLDLIGAWLAGPGRDGGVVSCSALALRYRDRLRAAAPDAWFVHLDVPRPELERRLAARRGHFMPARLLDSQLAALEPLTPAEQGRTVAAVGTPADLAAEIATGLRAAAGDRA